MLTSLTGSHEKAAVLLAPILTVMSCSSELRPGPEQEPAWVIAGSRTISDGDTRVFSGVGVAPDFRSGSLTAQVAEARAFEEARRLVASCVLLTLTGSSSGFWLIDSSAGRSAPGASGDTPLQTPQEVAFAVAEATITKATIVTQWVSATGTAYALALVSLEDVQSIVHRMRNLSPEAREVLSKGLSDGFDLYDRTQDRPDS